MSHVVHSIDEACDVCPSKLGHDSQEEVSGCDCTWSGVPDLSSFEEPIFGKWLQISPWKYEGFLCPGPKVPTISDARLMTQPEFPSKTSRRIQVQAQMQLAETPWLPRSPGERIFFRVQEKCS